MRLGLRVWTSSFLGGGRPRYLHVAVQSLPWDPPGSSCSVRRASNTGSNKQTPTEHLANRGQTSVRVAET